MKTHDSLETAGAVFFCRTKIFERVFRNFILACHCNSLILHKKIL